MSSGERAIAEDQYGETPRGNQRAGKRDVRSVLILIPCFNDWEALARLLPQIDSVLYTWQRQANAPKWSASVLVVDDASTEPMPKAWPCRVLDTIESVNVLRLRCNLSHQRAIAVGLYHAHEFTQADAILVMDGDGEDRPEDLPVLLEEFDRHGERKAIFAARTRRLESFSFQFFYRAFRLIHYFLTGMEVRVGNFSVLPRAALTRLMAVSDLWNHYANAVYRSKIPRELLPLARGKRLAGESRMNFVSLLLHGLAAMSVFSDYIAARLLAASSVLAIAGLGLALWNGMTLTAGVLLALSAQSLTFATLFALTIIGRRSTTNFLPLRDATHFILDTTVCFVNSSRHRLKAFPGRSSSNTPLFIEPEMQPSLLSLALSLQAVAPLRQAQQDADSEFAPVQSISRSDAARGSAPPARDRIDTE
jgi:polyisoprenyl-phosphate glycosyltransferase